MADVCQQAQMDTESPATPVSSLSGSVLFDKLPMELQLEIVSYCTIEDYNALGLINKYFRNLRIQYLFHVESRRPAYPASNVFPCYSCGQFLFWLEFADAEKRDDKKRGRSAATTRICLLCALKAKNHGPGDMVIHCGRDQYVCRTCNKFCGIYQTAPPLPNCTPKPIETAPWSMQMIQSARNYNLWANNRTRVAPILPMPKSYLREYHQQRELKRVWAKARKAKTVIKRAKATIKAARSAPKHTKAARKEMKDTIKAAKATIKEAMATTRKAKAMGRKAAIKAAASIF